MASTSWFTPDLFDNRQFTHTNCWKVEILLKSKERTTQTPTTGVSVWFVSLRNNYLEVFLILKIFLKLLKISSKLPITKNDYSNMARATLLKSLLAVDIFLQISQQFRNILRKEHLKKVAFAAFFQVKIKVFDSKSSF